MSFDESRTFQRLYDATDRLKEATNRSAPVAVQASKAAAAKAEIDAITASIVMAVESMSYHL